MPKPSDRSSRRLETGERLRAGSRPESAAAASTIGVLLSHLAALDISGDPIANLEAVRRAVEPAEAGHRHSIPKMQSQIPGICQTTWSTWPTPPWHIACRPRHPQRPGS